jgi:hypothetical protein
MVDETPLQSSPEFARDSECLTTTAVARKGEPVANALQTIEPKAEATAPPQTRSQRAIWFAIEAVAILFWLYALMKVFVFDLDNYLVARFLPSYQHLLAFKFPVLLGVVAVALLLVRKKWLIGPCIYTALYPFIVVLWKIPKFLFKQPNQCSRGVARRS